MTPKTIPLWGHEHRPNFRILSIESEIRELKQILYWMKIIETHRKAQLEPDGSPMWEVPQHGIAKIEGWENVVHVETEIRRGEEMIVFLKELLRHGILWYG